MLPLSRIYTHRPVPTSNPSPPLHTTTGRTDPSAAYGCVSRHRGDDPARVIWTSCTHPIVSSWILPLVQPTTSPGPLPGLFLLGRAVSCHAHARMQGSCQPCLECRPPSTRVPALRIWSAYVDLRCLQPWKALDCFHCKVPVTIQVPLSGLTTATSLRLQRSSDPGCAVASIYSLALKPTSGRLYRICGFPWQRGASTVGPQPAA